MYSKIVEAANKLLSDNSLLDKPIDIIKIANNNDIKIFEQNLPDSVSGIIIVKPEIMERYGSSKVIVVEINNHPLRKRFTIAHELGHYFLHKLPQEEYFAYRDEGQNKPQEIEANYFAASLLMPESMIKTSVEECRELFWGDVSSALLTDFISSAYQVSPAAASVRLKQLHII